MSEELFQVVFRGKILTGFTPEQVRAQLALLFRTDENRIAAQLALPKWVIKSALSKASALQIQEKLRGLGMMVAVIADDAAAAKTPEPALTQAPQPEPTRASDSGQTAPVGQVPNTQEPGRRTPGIGVLDDQPLDTAAKVAAFQADLSAYSLADLGAIMDQSSTKTAAKRYDLDQFSLAEVGAVIGEKLAIKPLEIDISAMSLAPAEILIEEPRSSFMREMDS
jgi:hypothetical protein